MQGVVREALRQLSPGWIACMRDMSAWRKLETANDLWVSAREQLVLQGLEAGLSAEAADTEAALRLMSGNIY